VASKGIAGTIFVSVANKEVVCNFGAVLRCFCQCGNAELKVPVFAIVDGMKKCWSAFTAR
jgi:hypothetical protein